MNYKIVLPANKQLALRSSVKDEYIARKVVKKFRKKGVLAFYQEVKDTTLTN